MLKPQAELTRLLRDAVRTSGITGEMIQALLPEPLHLSICSHSTGCQPTITAHRDGLPCLTVWEGSLWYSSCYEFNDRDKTLGLNPEFAAIEPKIEAFFDAVQALVNQNAVDTVLAMTAESAGKATRRKAAVAAYLTELED